MKKLLTLSAILFAFVFYMTPVQTVEASEKTENFVIYSAPIDYPEWKEAGNIFWGGYEGMINYFSSLSEEDRTLFISNGKYSNDGFLKADSLKIWRETANLTVEYMYRVLK